MAERLCRLRCVWIMWMNTSGLTIREWNTLNLIQNTVGQKKKKTHNLTFNLPTYVFMQLTELNRLLYYYLAILNANDASKKWRCFVDIWSTDLKDRSVEPKIIYLRILGYSTCIIHVRWSCLLRWTVQGAVVSCINLLSIIYKAPSTSDELTCKYVLKCTEANIHTSQSKKKTGKKKPSEKQFQKVASTASVTRLS